VVGRPIRDGFVAKQRAALIYEALSASVAEPHSFLTTGLVHAARRCDVGTAEEVCISAAAPTSERRKDLKEGIVKTAERYSK